MKNQIFKQIASLVTGLSLVFSGVIPAAMADGNAVLSFNPTTQTVGLNSEFTVQVKVDTGSTATVGVDAIILFDPNKLEFVGPNTTEEAQAYATDFTMVIPTVDQVSTGRVVISGLIVGGSPKTGELTVSTARFKSKAATGTTTLSYAFDVTNKDDTTNDFSNVAPAPGSGMIDLLDS